MRPILKIPLCFASQLPLTTVLYLGTVSTWDPPREHTREVRIDRATEADPRSSDALRARGEEEGAARETVRFPPARRVVRTPASGLCTLVHPRAFCLWALPHN